ncbi:MAG: ArsR/SmtB family transcription factor [Spirochaetia bacterium]
MPIEVPRETAGESVELFFSPVVELLCLMHFLCSERHVHQDPVWSRRMRESLSERSRSTLSLLATQNWAGMAHLELPLTLGEFRDTAGFAEKLKGMGLLDFLFILFNSEVPRERLEAVRRDPALFNELYGELSWIVSGKYETIRFALLEGESFRDDLVFLFEDLDSIVFREKIEECEEQYETAMAYVRDKLQSSSPLDVLIEIKGSFFESRDFNRYIFCPAYFLHHHNIVSFTDDTALLLFNVNIAKTPSVDTNRLVNALKALGDGTRLEILRNIAHRPTYGKVLAARLELSGATVSRHLGVLRTADLIEEEKKGGVKFFRLKGESFHWTIEALEEYLTGRID